MNRTLDQIRADHALAATGLKKRAVTRLPAMILTNGLLATAAFALDKEEELLDAMNAVAKHLRQTGTIQLPRGDNDDQRARATAKDLLEDLKSRDSAFLRLATAEALAYLAFLKRFAQDEQP